MQSDNSGSALLIIPKDHMASLLSLFHKTRTFEHGHDFRVADRG